MCGAHNARTPRTPTHPRSGAPRLKFNAKGLKCQQESGERTKHEEWPRCSLQFKQPKRSSQTSKARWVYGRNASRRAPHSQLEEHDRFYCVAPLIVTQFLNTKILLQFITFFCINFILYIFFLINYKKYILFVVI